MAAALVEARQDWYSERRVFRCTPSMPGEPHQAWWDQENWRINPGDDCPWAAALGCHPNLQSLSTWAASDGGCREDIVTCAYVFADTPGPPDPTMSPPRPASTYRQQARLPRHIGTRKCGVHEGELAALLGVVAAAPEGTGCIIAVDRLALLDLIDSLPHRTRRDIVKGNFAPWEIRLKPALLARDEALPPDAVPLVAPTPPDAQEWRMSSVYRATLFVHSPSHQPLHEADRVPCNLLATLNHWADLGCEEAQARDPPARVMKPAGGTRFFFEHLGQAVIGDPAVHIREWFAGDACVHLADLKMQGFIASRAEELWDLDLAKWRAVAVLPGLEPLAVELAPSWEPGQLLDMHKWIFRIRQGLGGSYISLARRNATYRQIANRIADDLDPDARWPPLSPMRGVGGLSLARALRLPVVRAGRGGRTVQP